jgi:hypothetical protein
MRSKEHLFDVRCVERNIRKGLVKREDYKKYLKALREAAPASGGGQTHHHGDSDDSST